MLTNNFHSIVGTMPEASNITKGILPLKDVYGIQRFATGQYSSGFPSSPTAACTLDAYAAGISVGSGTTEPTEIDYRLESPITSNIAMTIAGKSVESNGGSPYLKYNITITNTSPSDDVTISEIGYKQPTYATQYLDGTSSSSCVVLIDRTLVEPAVTLSPSEAVVVEYRLMTSKPARTVDGVKMVSWHGGSDDDVAAMIVAARNGTIDLAEDGGWQLGDVRTVTVGSFVINDETVPSQDVDLVITSFDDYNECGSILQVDFYNCITTSVQMNTTGSNVEGYGGSMMCESILPSLEAAMPQWLRSLMLTFDVLVKEGGSSDDIETVSDNKMALRSVIEVMGAHASATEGEGSKVAWYGNEIVRQKMGGRSGSSTSYWTRSPKSSTTTSFMYIFRNGTSYGYANYEYGLAPFFCL